MTEELKKEMLKPLIRRIFELSEKYDDTFYFGKSEEDKINFIIMNL